MLGFIYLIDKELVKTAMTYIDHNRHDILDRKQPHV